MRYFLSVFCVLQISYKDCLINASEKKFKRIPTDGIHRVQRAEGIQKRKKDPRYQVGKGCPCSEQASTAPSKGDLLAPRPQQEHW